ncbi:MAG: hypothetical protein ACLFU6_07355 [Candidatus Hydrogenedentota bacterium]
MMQYKPLTLGCVAILVMGVAQAGQMPLGTNFWSINWHGATDVFEEGHENVSGANPWNPRFLEEIAPYEVLRFMDWGKVNNSGRERFAQRKKKDDPNQSPEVAYEWMIDLCNRANADLWVCVPHKAEWEYSRELAELIQRELDPDLKVYVEYSNETWNGMFDQFQYCIDQGVELNLPGQDMEPGENQYYCGWAYHVYAAVRHFENFEEVFSGEARDRLVTVLAGQTGRLAVYRHHLAVLEDETVNPNGVSPDAYALAPYFGHEADGADPEVFDELRKDLHERVAPNVREHAREVQEAGMELIAYEGGQHLLDNAVIANRDQAMYDMYMEYFEVMDDHFSGVFAHYVHVGVGTPRHMWGALEETGQDLGEAPKYRAILDYAGQSDRP